MGNLNSGDPNPPSALATTIPGPLIVTAGGLYFGAGAGTSVLTSTTLGAGVVNASLNSITPSGATLTVTGALTATNVVTGSYAPNSGGPTGSFIGYANQSVSNLNYAFLAESTSFPAIGWYNTSNAANQKLWVAYTSATTFVLGSTTDAGGTTPALTLVQSNGLFVRAYLGSDPGNTSGLGMPALTATTILASGLGAFAAGDKYVVVDASGNFHKSALGPAS